MRSRYPTIHLLFAGLALFTSGCTQPTGGVTPSGVGLPPISSFVPQTGGSGVAAGSRLGGLKAGGRVAASGLGRVGAEAAAGVSGEIASRPEIKDPIWPGWGEGAPTPMQPDDGAPQEDSIGGALLGAGKSVVGALPGVGTAFRGTASVGKALGAGRLLEFGKSNLNGLKEKQAEAEAERRRKQSQKEDAESYWSDLG